MIKNESFSENMKFKKFEINEIKRMNSQNKKTNIKNKDNISLGKTFKYNRQINENLMIKKINEDYLRKYSHNIKTKSYSNLNYLQKSFKNFLNKKNVHRSEEDADKNYAKKDFVEKSLINDNKQTKNKYRYLTYFEISNSSIKDDNKGNVILNDFIISNENNYKENINIKSNLQLETQNNRANFLIKVNKKNNFHTKNLYIQEFENLKEKLKMKEAYENYKKIENESRRTHILKIPTKTTNNKINKASLIKKRYKKTVSYFEVDNVNDNNISQNNNNNIYQINSFRLVKKNFLLNNNLNNKKNSYLTYKRMNTEEIKYINQGHFNFEEKMKNNRKTYGDLTSIMDYEKRKIKVSKNKTPINLIDSFKERNLTLGFENDKLNLDNFKSPKKDENLKTLSVKKEKVNNTSYKDKIFLLNKINMENSFNNKKVLSLNKKRYITKKWKKKIKIENFDFEELNKRLSKIIQNLEKHEVKKEIKDSKKNKDGFIKWDNFEKVIQDN